MIIDPEDSIDQLRHQETFANSMAATTTVMIVDVVIRMMARSNAAGHVRPLAREIAEDIV
jgi:hypothetical protein